MAAEFIQQDYYSVDEIVARLQPVLGSDEWEQLKATDLGQSLLRTGANIVHQDAMAFFIGLNEFFLSTNTMSGYLEEIAKSNGVIPETYQSANLTITLYSNSEAKSYAPMDFSFSFGGTRSKYRAVAWAV